jgi:hypothetical protein
MPDRSSNGGSTAQHNQLFLPVLNLCSTSLKHKFKYPSPGKIMLLSNPLRLANICLTKAQTKAKGPRAIKAVASTGFVPVLHEVQTKAQMPLPRKHDAFLIN